MTGQGSTHFFTIMKLLLCSYLDWPLSIQTGGPPLFFMPNPDIYQWISLEKEETTVHTLWQYISGAYWLEETHVQGDTGL